MSASLKSKRLRSRLPEGGRRRAGAVESPQSQEASELHMKGYANPDLLWSADDLHARLEDPALCLVDTRPTHEYVAGHILGALHLDLYGFSLNDTSETAFSAFMWTCGYLLGSRGIGSDKRIVFYENDSGMRAARGFWICEYLGHEDVHVLDGGVAAWRAMGYPLTTACTVPERSVFEARPVPERQIGAEELRDALGQEGFVVLDTRSDDEYYGRIARAARAGAIPEPCTWSISETWMRRGRSSRQTS